MKQFLRLALAVMLFAMANAQTKRTNQVQTSSSDTTWHNLNESKKRVNINDGDVKMHTEPGKYDLYATYKNKEVMGYYAKDSKGEKVPATLTKSRGGCVYCISLPEPGGTRKTVCWWEFPCVKSPKRPTIKSRN